MRYIDRHSPFTSVLASPGAMALLEAEAADVLQSPILKNLSEFPVGPILTLILGSGDPRIDPLIAKLAHYEDTAPELPTEPTIEPSPTYEPESVRRGSATTTAPDLAETNRRTEIVLHSPAHGNPFVDVELAADFVLDERVIHVGGFYDGNGTYKIRFLPPEAGAWRFATTSNARSLDGIEGTIQVALGTRPGPVRVVDQFHFGHADGSRYTPIGTTAYAWTHQAPELQEQTLQSLASGPFNKVRMCLFPKSFLYNSNEPERFVFERDAVGGWDTTRFDIDYFTHLERRIDDLDRLGVVADLILFHPYDRWGFSTLTKAADDRYVRYATRRLSAFTNVWWSMANEYDLLLTKRPTDWDRLAGIVQANDPVDHPLSIHNWVEIYDYSAEWVSHCSIQRGDYRIGEMIDGWRRTWGKPVIIDEFGYEGDLDQGWGNLLAEEVVRRFWDGTVRGGYLSHGETYYSADEVIWWSKGGTLRGDSIPRLEFLRQIIAQAPTGRIDPLPSDWDAPWGGAADEYILIYFGASRPLFRTVNIPAGMTAAIDVIDTWNMTIDERPGVHSGDIRVDLPARPYVAIRLRAVAT